MGAVTGREEIRKSLRAAAYILNEMGRDRAHGAVEKEREPYTASGGPWPSPAPQE